MDDGHINPDHPLLQQIDTLFRQLAQGRVIPTENDIKFVDLIADALRLWAGIPIVPPEMLEDMRNAPPVPEVPDTWAEYVAEAKHDAMERRN